MTFQLNGGLDPAADYPILDPLADLTSGENHAFWFFDDRGKYALLNCHIQGGGTVPPGRVVSGDYQAFPDWETRRIIFPVAGPDGALHVDFAVERGGKVDGYELGGWSFRCEQPFRRWTGRYRGAPRLTSTAETCAGIIPIDGPRRGLEIDLTMEMALPVWMRGDFAEDLPGRERAMLATGLPRYEQVYRVMGEVRVEGEPAYPFTGTGVRTHRYGRRVATGDWFHGSSWLSALFPSGRAFGSVQYLGNSGEAVYSDAAVTDVRGLPVQARVTATPWLTRYDCVGQRVEWCYEQDGKPGVIRGEIVAAAYNYGFGLDRTPGIVNWCHTMTRFEWDGEETYGMMELGMITDRLID